MAEEVMPANIRELMEEWDEMTLACLASYLLGAFAVIEANMEPNEITLPYRFAINLAIDYAKSRHMIKRSGL